VTAPCRRAAASSERVRGLARSSSAVVSMRSPKAAASTWSPNAETISGELGDGLTQTLNWAAASVGQAVRIKCPEERGNTFLHLLSPQRQSASPLCILCWRSFSVRTVTHERQICFCLVLLEIALLCSKIRTEDGAISEAKLIGDCSCAKVWVA
jgi:hypothetical protein